MLHTVTDHVNIFLTIKIENMEKNIDWQRCLQKLKAYEINSINKMRKEQMTFLKKLEMDVERMLKKQTLPKEWLTITEVMDDFSISRKTFDRLRGRGLEVWQPVPNGKVLVNRNLFINFLKAQK